MKRTASSNSNERTTKRRKTQSGKSTSVRKLAEKALELATKASKSIERKAADFLVTTNISSVGSSFHYTAIAQGTTTSQRVGNDIYVTGLGLNYYWTTNATPASMVVRFVVFMDTQQQSDDTSHDWLEVFQNSNIMAMVNRTGQKNRYKILYDKFHNLSTATNYSVGEKVFIPINQTVEFNGTASGDIQKNGIFGLALSTELTNTAPFTCYSRTYYRDA